MIQAEVFPKELRVKRDRATLRFNDFADKSSKKRPFLYF